MCRDQGFALAGVARVAPTQREHELRQWVAVGAHGSMDWFREQLEDRMDLRRVLREARSVLMVADQYAVRGEAEQPLPPGHAKIARYARGRDYHRLMKKRLHAMADLLRERYPGNKFRSFVDTAPVLEREQALRCGLGWVAKNTMIIHPRLGSYFLLGGFATSLELDPPDPQVPSLIDDACGTCTRCIEACPTGAITPYAVDASRCVSYLTIERKVTIPPEFHAAIGDWIYGCDICQEVCPHNSPRAWTPESSEIIRPEYRSERAGLDLSEVMAWDDEARRTAFRQSPMKRADLMQMVRNAVIAAGNSIIRGDLPAEQRHRLLEGVRARASDDRPQWAMVQQTAAQTLARIESASAAQTAGPAAPAPPPE